MKKLALAAISIAALAAGWFFLQRNPSPRRTSSPRVANDPQEHPILPEGFNATYDAELSLKLSLAKNRVKPGEPIYFSLELKNVGNFPHLVDDEFWQTPSAPRPHSQVRIFIEDETGSSVKYSLKALTSPLPDRPRSPFSKYLSPGESLFSPAWTDSSKSQPTLTPPFGGKWTQVPGYEIFLPGRYKMWMEYGPNLVEYALENGTPEDLRESYLGVTKSNVVEFEVFK